MVFTTSQEKQTRLCKCLPKSRNVTWNHNNRNNKVGQVFTDDAKIDKKIVRNHLPHLPVSKVAKHIFDWQIERLHNSFFFK